LESEGKIRFLGAMSETRSPLALHVPTFKEQGVDIISGSSRGLAAPKDVPADILAKLEAAVDKAVNDPEYVAKAKKSYVPLNYLTGAQYQELIQRFEKDLRALWAESPWK
jgi:tripartite-type tricarboxylate transporter receptor subunit TctC